MLYVPLRMLLLYCLTRQCLGQLNNITGKFMYCSSNVDEMELVDTKINCADYDHDSSGRQNDVIPDANDQRTFYLLGKSSYKSSRVTSCMRIKTSYKSGSFFGSRESKLESSFENVSEYQCKQMLLHECVDDFNNSVTMKCGKNGCDSNLQVTKQQNLFSEFNNQVINCKTVSKRVSFQYSIVKEPKFNQCDFERVCKNNHCMCPLENEMIYWHIPDRVCKFKPIAKFDRVKVEKGALVGQNNQILFVLRQRFEFKLDTDCINSYQYYIDMKNDKEPFQNIDFHHDGDIQLFKSTHNHILTSDKRVLSWTTVSEKKLKERTPDFKDTSSNTSFTNFDLRARNVFKILEGFPFDKSRCPAWPANYENLKLCVNDQNRWTQEYSRVYSELYTNELSCNLLLNLLELFKNHDGSFFKLKFPMAEYFHIYVMHGQLWIPKCFLIDKIKFLPIIKYNGFCDYYLPVEFVFEASSYNGFIDYNGIISQNRKLVECHNIHQIFSYEVVPPKLFSNRYNVKIPYVNVIERNEDALKIKLNHIDEKIFIGNLRDSSVNLNHDIIWGNQLLKSDLNFSLQIQSQFNESIMYVSYSFWNIFFIAILSSFVVNMILFRIVPKVRVPTNTVLERIHTRLESFQRGRQAKRKFNIF